MGIFHRLSQLHEVAYERLLGISTIEYHDIIDLRRPEFRGYAPTLYRNWCEIRPHLRAKGAFIDFGAGLGRVTVLAARMRFDRVIGIELQQALAERANANVARARGLKCDARILCQDATAFEVPTDAGVLFFFNPFTGTTLAKVLDNVHRSYVDNPRPMQIVAHFAYPSVSANEMRGVGWLRLASELGLSHGRNCWIFEPRS
jgi:SAM-dependent methyltransferase